MLVPELNGGLGNMMFQMASVYAISKETGHRFAIRDIPLPPSNHSSIDYKTNIFKQWYPLKTNMLPSHKIIEHSGEPISLDILKRLEKRLVVLMSGYFQNYQYFESYKKEIVSLFSFPWNDHLEEKYENISNAYFLHVRRGDYLQNEYHELNLMDYYRRAIQHMNGGVAYIVSNDMEWVKNWDLIKCIPHRFIEENEVDTLSIMMRCGKGGIAANSSFSWWGLYLNTNRPHLILPNRWFPHDFVYSKGYYFKEATILPLEETESFELDQ